MSYIGIDLFSGAGGLALGLQKAGFEMKLGVEIDHSAANTLKQNHKDMDVIIDDIGNIDINKIKKTYNVKKDEVCIISGGPPCRGFSRSNKRNRNMNNPLNNLYLEFFKFIKKFNPTFFLFENVEGLKNINNGDVFNKICQHGKSLKYHISFNVIDTENYGIPQKRKRLFIIGSKKRLEDNLFLSMDCKKYTVREAINDLPILENGNRIDILPYSNNTKLSTYQTRIRLNNNTDKVANNKVTLNGKLILKRYQHIPEGGNWRNIPKRLMHNYKNLENCHRWIYYRLKWDEPSIIISNYRKNMLIHPSQNRGLSVREAARLQSFPDDYIFYGSLYSQQQQIANAVPPLLAEKIGCNIMKIIKDN